jgi:DNA topoisomerase-1
MVDEPDLVYVTDASPGISRVGQRGRWVYLRPDGSALEDTAWVEAIGIPPAWTDVWISPVPNGHLLATGRDARGRKQYRYHPRWRQVRDATKYDRMVAFGDGLPSLRTRIEQDLSLSGLVREKVLGAVVRLMDETLIRIGNEEYARTNRHFGLTTLQDEHARVEGPVIRFEFRAKSGKEQQVLLQDPRLAAIVAACQELPGEELFQYVDDEGRVVDVGSRQVNEYLRSVTRAFVTAKDFRTWGGSVTAAETLVDLGPPPSKRKLVAAIDAAAERLNNTRAVCRACYLHPGIPQAYVEGRLADAFAQVAEREGLSRSESAVLAVVAEKAVAAS